LQKLKKITKNEMRSFVFPLLNKEFNCRIYFNSEQPDNIRILKKQSGVCYYKERIIVIKWRRQFEDSLRILIHELGHLGVITGKAQEYQRFWIETEADMVSYAVFELLGIELTNRDTYSTKKNDELKYVEELKKKGIYEVAPDDCDPVLLDLPFGYDRQIRWDEIESTAHRIVSVIQDSNILLLQ